MAAGFLATDFFAVAFFFAGGSDGIGMVMPPWPWCWAREGDDARPNAKALTAVNKLVFTMIFQSFGAAPIGRRRLSIN